MVEEVPTDRDRSTILCIDDDRLVLGVCTSALEAHGYRVVMATNGHAGIAIAEKERPALILLDVFMPGMDGFEVCRQLRAEPAFRHTPIVILTAMSEPDLEAKGMEAGATLSIRKPFDPAQVVSTVEQCLGKKR
jgi:putative two-component system response regulator